MCVGGGSAGGGDGPLRMPMGTGMDMALLLFPLLPVLLVALWCPTM